MLSRERSIYYDMAQQRKSTRSLTATRAIATTAPTPVCVK